MDNIYEALQWDLLRSSEEILRLEAKLLLPRIGGYKVRPFSITLNLLEPPRASEVKALWRWWLRAVLAGCYGGRKNYRELESYIGDLLGSTNNQSPFSVIIEFNPEEVARFHERSLKIYKLMECILNASLKFLKECRIKGASINYVSLKPPFRVRFKINSSIRFKGVKDLQVEFHEELKKCLGVVPRLKIIRRKGQAEVIFTDSSSLKTFLEKQGLLKEGIDLRLYDKIVELSKIPRYTLLLQPRKELGESDKLTRSQDVFNSVKSYIERIAEELTLPDELSTRIIVLAKKHNSLRPDEKRLKLAISALLLSLVLGGLGSITRRAFGSITSLSIKYFDKALNTEIELLKKLSQASSEEELKNCIEELINHCIGLAREVYHVKELPQEGDLPIVPSLIMDKYFKLRVIECTERNQLDLLDLIGHACLKQEWKIALGGRPTDPGEALHTWILGLPRSTKNTGYFVDSNKGRRPSAIHFKLLETRNGKTFIIIYGFLSKDWNVGKIIHKGSRHPQGRRVKSLKIAGGLRGLQNPPQKDDVFIRRVFEEAFNIVYKIIKDKCSRG